MATTTAPLTPEMRAALRRRPLGVLVRQLPWIGVVVALVGGFGVVAVRESGELDRGLLAFVGIVFGGMAVFLLVGALVQAHGSWRALRRGHYARYAGPLHLRVELQGRPGQRIPMQLLWIGEDLILDDDAGAATAVPLESLMRGTAAYAPDAPMLFAVWDEQGRCAYRHRSYNLDADLAVAPPGQAIGTAVA